MLQQDQPDDYVQPEKPTPARVRRTGFRLRRQDDRMVRQRPLREVDRPGTGRGDPGYFRPTEVDSLLGDASKARTRLGWRHKTTFATLVVEIWWRRT
jgi:GDPmannose 4,6-dehydratase